MKKQNVIKRQKWKQAAFTIITKFIKFFSSFKPPEASELKTLKLSMYLSECIKCSINSSPGVITTALGI